jgi:aminoglycoside 3-N-acetyltransferase
MPYNQQELFEAYEQIGVAPGKVIYATSDLTNVVDYEVPGGRVLVEVHYNTIMKLLGKTGTLVIPSASTQLCNTNIPYDPKTTPSSRVGALSEYARQQPDMIRSNHPFVSYAAIGPLANEIVSDVSRNSYGPETPEARMIEMGVLNVCIGVEPRVSCSTIHQVEQMMGVPYRYTKEFRHPVVRDGKVVEDLFYMYVWYQNTGFKRDQNRKLFDRFDGRLHVNEVNIGRAKLYSYSLADFFKEACREFAKDIYIWCDHVPENRPYQTG